MRNSLGGVISKAALPQAGITGLEVKKSTDQPGGPVLVWAVEITEPSGDVTSVIADTKGAIQRVLLPPSRAAIRAELAAVAPKVLPFMAPTFEILDSERRAGKRILFEGAQGALLDVDHGTYPYVTSSNTVAAVPGIEPGTRPPMSS